MSLYIGEKITHKNTLFFFDEIQTEPSVLKSLKYFYEQAPEYHIIAAGSLLGVSIGKNYSFPVGKVNFITMYPMSFIEYLMAADEEFILQQYKDFTEPTHFKEIIHSKLIKHLKIYMFLGGMPEVLNEYIQNKDIQTAREIQKEILEAYTRDSALCSKLFQKKLLIFVKLIKLYATNNNYRNAPCRNFLTYTNFTTIRRF